MINKFKTETVLQNKDVVEFATVAVEFNKFLEQAGQRTCKEFVTVALRLLPLLYLKASLLPHWEVEDEMELESVVTEEDYNAVRGIVARVLGTKDDYLDVFVQDMKYSDKPVLKTISEDMADIWQDIKNFTEVFQQGLETTMHDSLALVQQNFELYWGQTLVNTLRALHDVCYNQEDDSENE